MRPRVVVASLAILTALALPVSAAAPPLDRGLPVGDTDYSLAIIGARLTSGDDGKELAITASPSRPLSITETQAAEERLFDDYVMASAARRGIDRVSIYVPALQARPSASDVRRRSSTFIARPRGAWSLESRWAVDAPDSSATLRLDDGTSLKVESDEIVRERMDGIAMPTMRVQILLKGLNPMLESDEIYTVLKDSWSQIFHQRAEDRGLRSVELIAHVDARKRRFEVRDATMLQLVASNAGAFPPLPVFPEAELQEPSIYAPAGSAGQAEARFGHLDTTRFDRILDDSLKGSAPAGVVSQPLALLSR
jgi:hypothetical protein